MNKPVPKPINPETPRAKSVKIYPLNNIYPDSMKDDVYIRPDRDSIYSPIDLEKTKEKLDKTENENTENSN